MGWNEIYAINYEEKHIITYIIYINEEKKPQRNIRRKKKGNRTRSLTHTHIDIQNSQYNTGYKITLGVKWSQSGWKARTTGLQWLNKDITSRLTSEASHRWTGNNTLDFGSWLQMYL